MIGCVSGRDAALKQNSSISLSASYFDPPYMVNNGDNLYNISYKTVAVTASHYDGTLVRAQGSYVKMWSRSGDVAGGIALHLEFSLRSVTMRR